MNDTPRPPLGHDEYLTIEEVMTLLRLPRSTLSNWRYRQVGPRYVRVGRQVRYPSSAVRDFLEEHTISTDASSR